MIRGKGGKIDLYKDEDGNVYEKAKGNKGPGEKIDYNLKDLRNPTEKKRKQKRKQKRRVILLQPLHQIKRPNQNHGWRKLEIL